MGWRNFCTGFLKRVFTNVIETIINGFEISLVLQVVIQLIIFTTLWVRYIIVIY